jgi:hypothetical protein
MKPQPFWIEEVTLGHEGGAASGRGSGDALVQRPTRSGEDADVGI